MGEVLLALGINFTDTERDTMVFDKADKSGDGLVSAEEMVSALYVQPPLQTLCEPDFMSVTSGHVYPGNVQGA
jgi:hypothetical protein